MAFQGFNTPPYPVLLGRSAPAVLLRTVVPGLSPEAALTPTGHLGPCMPSRPAAGNRLRYYLLLSRRWPALVLKQDRGIR